MSKGDGGPAFPFVDHAELTTIGLGHGAAADVPTSRPGMTLRDYFAAAALTGFCSIESSVHDWLPERMAVYAYQQADAMLKAREEGS